MRILHIIDHWGLGGAQRALAALIRHERRHEHSVAAVFEHHRQDWDLPQNVPLIFLTRSYSGLGKTVFTLRRHLRRYKPDVIQVHLNGARFLVAMALWGMPHKPVLIWHEHSGQELLKKYGYILGRMLLGWQRSLVKQVNRVVGNSESTLTYLAEFLRVPSRRTALIHCPVDTEHILALAEGRLQRMPEGARTNGPVAGFIGRLADQKGPGDLIAAAQNLQALAPAAQMWVVGEGPLRPSLEKAVHAQGLADHVIFWGQRRDVYAIMQAMSMILMPSRYEPFGLVAVEAFVLGKPVVGYAVDGLAEVLALSPLGIAVPPGDHSALVNAVLACLENPPRDESAPVRHPFEPEVICAAWDELYLELAVAHGG